MAKLAAVALAFLASAAAWTQTPDVSIRLDAYPTYRNTQGRGSTFRWYDPMGRPSTIGLGLKLESGFYAYVAERFQTIRGDGDDSLIDEAYLEDPGSWRLGKQILPFGQRALLRESVVGARADTLLFRRQLPVQLAVFDSGDRKPRGIMVRVGDSIGFSVAVGRHLGISSASLTAVREPEDSPGKGAGYEIAAGVDAFRNIGALRLEAEYLGLRRPAIAAHPPIDVTDFRVQVRPADTTARIVAAWARSWRDHQDVYRMEGEVQVSRNVTLRSFLRFANSTFRDFGIGARIRL